MERTQVYLTPDQKEALLMLSREKAIPMAELIRNAIEEYLIRHNRDNRRRIIQETFGAVPEWSVNGQSYTREIRGGWAKRVQGAEEGEDNCRT